MKNNELSKYVRVIADFRISEVLFTLIKKNHICGKDLRLIANNNHLILIKKLKKHNIITLNDQAKKEYILYNNISNYHGNKLIFYQMSSEFIKLLSKKGLFMKIINLNCSEEFKKNVLDEVKLLKQNRINIEKSRELRYKIATMKTPRLRNIEDKEIIKEFESLKKS